MNKKHTAKITINPEAINYYDGLMRRSFVDLSVECLPKYGNASAYGVEFDDGRQFDVRVNTSADDVWCEGILFDKDGLELRCTDVNDTLEGTWRVECDGDVYEVEVVALDYGVPLSYLKSYVGA